MLFYYLLNIPQTHTITTNSGDTTTIKRYNSFIDSFTACDYYKQGELLYFRDFSGYIKRVISEADFLGDADTEKYKKAVKQYATI